MNKQTNEWIKDYEQTNGQKQQNERMNRLVYVNVIDGMDTI